ncbi:DUF2637 domain-containing protein [Streptomyces sp. CoT10]|uniref:DUF2637 domain-containing protein n=1 Tax=Streptomyces sp. CoT10 TaxID=2875762 RepID=UPI001CD748A6|nr:DUF2637 domain-containing protein [Streptomyces sp. CoT10]
MAPVSFSRAQRLLIGVVITGTILITGIGFAGSYTAVRGLAATKGFGTFSYLFPIGIDAGICVLLALDLLLTWIRIPFPLLRQTAWLLTAATIAFNGAAAWPDPLGVGMHAIIPVLFVVAVEAARHAIGRIADITADQHMEGIRLTRWLLSPVPTLLLWRRMKLWELRSYEQVIKVEQQRLVYQARLRSRYGRAWRRKAPVDCLMPLRLARYGIPLPHTTPAGPAAPSRGRMPGQAGTEPAIGSAPGAMSPPRAAKSTPLAQQAPDCSSPDHSPRPPAQSHQPDENSHPRHTGQQGADDSPGAYHAPPTRRRTVTAPPPPHSQGAPAPSSTHAAKEQQGARAHATITAPSPTARPAPKPALTVVDRYYQAWTHYRDQNGKEPTAQQLSSHLDHLGIHSRSGQPVRASTLRRYLLPYRVYTIWAQHRTHTETPNPHSVAHDCITHNITGQYNKPLTPHYISEQTGDFERRWHALNQHAEA